MAAGAEVLRLAEALLATARDVSAAAANFGAGPLRADRVGLARKISLLVHLFEEIRDSAAAATCAPSTSCGGEPSPISWLADLLLAIEAARRFLSLECLQDGASVGIDVDSLETVRKTTSLQLQYVTWQLEKVLGNIPYNVFDVSDEVQEQVELVRTQLRRGTERNGPPNLEMFSKIYNIIYRTHSKNVIRHVSERTDGLQTEEKGLGDTDPQQIVLLFAENNDKTGNKADKIPPSASENIESCTVIDACIVTKEDDMANGTNKPTDEVKKSDALSIPEDFSCPISLELMRDPVIVSTGQTYERSSIQRWIDCGNHTCPKTQQKLRNLTLTPNYVLRSLITQWCQANNVEQPHRALRRIRKSDGSYQDICGDSSIIDELVLKLSCDSTDEQRSAAAEIRSLARRSTDNRVLIAEAGAVPVLIRLLSVDDPKIQEHAVTSLLNLSIYENNKGLIMLSGAISPIIHVLKMGNMEARENAAAAIFSLSLIDENKIIIGSTPGAFEALVDLLQNGSCRGKKDAATALFNLCIYQGNKPRAVRAGILAPLMKMLTDVPSNCMVDEALTILSVIVSHQEGKIAIAKANMIPVLVHLLRTGQPRHRENAAAILLALCKKDSEKLAFIERLGALGPLSELAKTGTERAKRKATSLLEHLNRLQRLQGSFPSISRGE